MFVQITKAGFLLLMVTALLQSCAPSNDSKKNDKLVDQPGSGGKGDVKTKNITDYSGCTNGIVPQSPSGVWVQNLDINGMRMDAKLFIEFNRVTFQNTCSFKGKSLTVKAQSSSRFTTDQTPNTLEFLSRDSKSESLNEDGIKIDCNIAVEPMALEYHFKGSCLVLNKKDSGTDEIVLIPQN